LEFFRISLLWQQKLYVVSEAGGYMIGRASGIVALVAMQAVAAAAQDQLTDARVSFVFDGARVEIAPNSPDAPVYAARFAALQPLCDPDCISPETAAVGVRTVIELDVLDFLVNEVAQNQGLLVDARMPGGRALGFIPGSVSLPHQTLSKDNAFRDDILKALGARAFEGVFNFADAQSLVVFDNGPSQKEASVLITQLLEAGYPPEKIRYFRGGMQVWSVVGLTVEE
jgi:rhodanese-related sulfurtransferase